MANNAGNITGSCDLLPVDEQLKMIRKMLPDAKKIGILYTTSEANSVSTIKEYKKVSDKYGFEIVDTGINTLADVDMAAKRFSRKSGLYLQPDRQHRSTGTSDRD